MTILRGAYAGAANALADHSARLVLRSASDWRAPVPWGTLRSFITQGLAALGDERVRQAVLPRRAMYGPVAQLSAARKSRSTA
jgi:hypothetical protein